MVAIAPFQRRRQGRFGLAMFIQLAHQRNAFCLQFAKSVAQLKPP